MSAKLTNIRWIGTGSQPCSKNMYSFVLQTNFHEIENNKINTSLVNQGLRPLGANRTGVNLIIFHFNIYGKLSLIQCDKNILQVSAGGSGLVGLDPDGAVLGTDTALSQHLIGNTIFLNLGDLKKN